MRLVMTAIAALALAGCHAAAPDNRSAATGPQPSEAQIENEYQSQQAALAASIENEANADEAEDGNASATLDPDQ